MSVAAALKSIESRPSAFSAFRDSNVPHINPDAGIKFNVFLSSFFDRDAVIEELSELEWVVFSKFGAYLRQRAMTSIRKGNKKGDASAPGTPPRSHDVRAGKNGRAKHLLRAMLFFGYDLDAKTLVVGPATQLVTALNAVGRNLAVVLDQGVKENKFH